MVWTFALKVFVENEHIPICYTSYCFYYLLFEEVVFFYRHMSSPPEKVSPLLSEFWLEFTFSISLSISELLKEQTSMRRSRNQSTLL